jgi:hypothetical protein
MRLMSSGQVTYAATDVVASSGICRHLRTALVARLAQRERGRDVEPLGFVP